MSQDEIVDTKRRQLLTLATGGLGAIGLGTMAVPFISSWQPSEKAKAAGAPVEVDISQLVVGQKLTVEWRGKPIWIVRRSEQMVQDLPGLAGLLRDPASNESMQPDYSQNTTRSIRKEYLVVEGVCTHLGCAPLYKPEKQDPDMIDNWQGGFFCPCHGSRFDLAGRVYQGVPAPTNLSVPPHHYLSDTVILIGEDQPEAV